MTPIMKNFTSELDRIYSKLSDMGQLTLGQLELVQRNIEMISTEKLETIIEIDKNVDRLEDDLQRSVMNLIMVQPPLSEELEALTVMQQISKDFERIGDQMVNIASSFQFIDFRAPHTTVSSVKEMAEKTWWMHKETLLLLEKLDKEKAEEVIKADEEVDSLFHQFREELPILVKSYWDNTDAFMQFFLISRYLERSADHSVNIIRRVMLIKE